MGITQLGRCATQQFFFSSKHFVTLPLSFSVQAQLWTLYALYGQYDVNVKKTSYTFGHNPFKPFKVMLLPERMTLLSQTDVYLSH